jgi:hypothetical protein
MVRFDEFFRKIENELRKGAEYGFGQDRGGVRNSGIGGQTEEGAEPHP